VDGIAQSARKCKIYQHFRHTPQPHPGPRVEYALLCLTSFAICGAGALLPVVNTEVYLIGAAALMPRPLLVPLVVAGTVGAMAGKVLLYYAGRGMVNLPWKRAQKGLAAMQARMEEKPAVGKLLYSVSAVVGLPPFYVTTLAAGAVKMNFTFFLVVGFIGRLIRFALVVALPQYAKGWWG
jgi:membrane protein YqaA with SNARE-associated domain